MYLHDMIICQEYASLNRKYIAKEILGNIKEKIEHKEFQTIHNYISFQDNIVRKGAISAKKFERVLILMNMRDGSIIAMCKGNGDWNQSVLHG